MFKNYMQIAGVIDEEEAGLLIECGVKSIGFPLRLSSHEEDLSEYVAANIIRSLPTSTHGVLITYLSEAVDVSELSKFLGTNIVQVHGDIEESELAKLRRITPNLVIIKSFTKSIFASEIISNIIMRYTYTQCLPFSIVMLQFVLKKILIFDFFCI